MKDEDCWVVVAEDVQKAFDSVRISDVLDAHRRIFTDRRVRRYLPRDASERERLLDWITKVLQGNDPKREKGIDQGNPYSPLALTCCCITPRTCPSQSGESRAGGDIQTT